LKTATLRSNTPVVPYNEGNLFTIESLIASQGGLCCMDFESEQPQVYLNTRTEER